MSLLDRTRGPLPTEHTPETSRPGQGDARIAGSHPNRPTEAVSGLQRRGLLGKSATSRSEIAQRRFDEIRTHVRSRLASEVDAETSSFDDVARAVAALVTDVSAARGIGMSGQDRRELVEAILDDVLGLGPLEHLLKDPNISDILINAHDKVYIERDGMMTRTEVRFESPAHLMRIIDRIVSRVGRRIDEAQPMADARLEDGARVHVVIPPLALSGPTVTIRRFSRDPLQIDDLVRFGSATPQMFDFLRACVSARLNIIVSGGGSSGKTTTLNVLSGFIPEDERILTIEDIAELQLRQIHIVPLESRPANIEGRGRVSIRDLVINALRMRPDRIVVGECRGAEALDMLQAMNTGHDGSLTTAHANSPQDVMSRLEVMILMAGNDLPSKAIREQIASAVHLVVHHARFRDGSRKMVSISEVVGMDDGHVKLQEIFAFHQRGLDAEGRVFGEMGPTGVVPKCLEMLSAAGQAVDVAMFGTEESLQV